MLTIEPLFAALFFMLFNHFVYLSLQVAKFCCLFVGNFLSMVLNDAVRW